MAAVSSYEKPLFFPYNELQPIDTDMWVKILGYLDVDSLDAQRASAVCKLFRSIIGIRRMAQLKAVQPLGYRHISTPADLLDAALLQPPFRLFRSLGVVKSTFSTWELIPAIYQATQLVSAEQFHHALNMYRETLKAILPEVASLTSFAPYAQKLIVQEGAECLIKGDLHGDLRSLATFLRRLQDDGYLSSDHAFKLIKPVTLIFLGDYVDRGMWGVEVLYLLLQLKICNPDQVFLIRGNHEDPEKCESLGFYHEYLSKIGPEGYESVAHFYHSLPVVLYLGTQSEEGIRFVQCCHAGVEWGYNPGLFLNHPDRHIDFIGTLARQSESQKMPLQQIETISLNEKCTVPLHESCVDFIPETPTNPYPVGFLWHLFHPDPEKMTTYDTRKKIYSCGRKLTLATFEAASHGKNTLDAMIRAHQHDPFNPLIPMLLAARGCHCLWGARVLEKGAVVTLLLSPDSDAGLDRALLKGFSYETTLHVRTAKALSDWKCTVLHTEIGSLLSMHG